MQSKKAASVTTLKVKPRIISRSEHSISRSDISDAALQVLYRLKSAGYQAYLVGGAVRDLLLQHKPKDFDVVTNAHPEQIRELFRSCRLIGRRFRLAHVRIGDEIIDVSTFRASHHSSDAGQQSEDGRILRDNVYGTIDDDVWRRDFTANALFYNIEDFSIVDYVGGFDDIQAKRLRLIGDAEARYREDPVRMLRAARFAAKLGFSIADEAANPIKPMAGLLKETPAARLYEEFNKLFLSGHGVRSYQLLNDYDLFHCLFPEAAKALRKDQQAEELLLASLQNTDQRLAEDASVTPGFIAAALLWAPLRDMVEQYLGNGLSEYDATQLASDAVISRQVKTVAMPRRVTMMSRDIWILQSRFKHRQLKRAKRLLAQKRFRAAFDFLELRSKTGEPLSEAVEWWRDFQEQHPQDLYNKQKQQSFHNKGKHQRRSRHKNKS